MIKQQLDDLVDILADKFAEMENTFVIRNNQQLAQYIDDPTKWKYNQMIHRNRFKKSLIQDAREQIRSINEKIEKVMLVAYKEVSQDAIEITETEIKVNEIPKSLQIKIKDMQKQATEDVIKLANTSYQSFNHTIRIIGDVKSAETLYDRIAQQMKIGVDNGIRVPYTTNDGKQRMMSWKCWMDMKTRTDVHQEMTNQQIEIGTKLNQIFYCTDHFSDCATDHSEFQDLLFYNAEADINEETQKYIDDHHCMSMQEAMERGLTTRPNCRHEFHSIPIQEAMEKSVTEIQKDEGFYKGTYKQQNYDLTQQQRYNERMIRKYKLRVENKKQVAKSNGNNNFKPSKEDTALIRKWQQKQVQLENKHPSVIKRNYEREKIGIIINDLGVRYDQKRKM